MAEKFESWAVVELFGHSRIAGLVSEQAIGGCSFVRVDVPETERSPAYSRLLGQGAIYAINPCSEGIARRAAAGLGSQPALQAYAPPMLPAETAAKVSRACPDCGFYDCDGSCRSEEDEDEPEDDDDDELEDEDDEVDEEAAISGDGPTEGEIKAAEWGLPEIFGQ